MLKEVPMSHWYLNLFKEMPKSELHLHLDGSLETKTVLDWLVSQPESKRRELGFDRLSWKELYEALGTEGVLENQTELLRYFDLPALVLQSEDGLRRAAAELVRRQADEKIVYSEIRWAPALHVTPQLPMEAVIEAVLTGACQMAARRGVHVGVIACGMRHLPLEENLRMLEIAARYRDRGLVGIDFAGVEAANPDPLKQLPYFERAHELGFQVTLHGGELASVAENLEEALKKIRPHRLSHGAVLSTRPEALAWLAENKVSLDVCPTSNWQAGLYPDFKAFPIPELREAGVPVTVSTDDPVVSRISLADEYANLYETGRYTVKTLWDINLEGVRQAWMPEMAKKELLAAFAAWAQNIEELKKPE